MKRADSAFIGTPAYSLTHTRVYILGYLKNAYTEVQLKHVWMFALVYRVDVWIHPFTYIVQSS